MFNKNNNISHSWSRMKYHPGWLFCLQAKSGAAWLGIWMPPSHPCRALRHQWVHSHLQEWDPGVTPPLAAAPLPAWQWMGKHSMAGFTGTLDSALLEAEWKSSMLKLAAPVPTRQEPARGILGVLQPLPLRCCNLPHWFLLSPCGSVGPGSVTWQRELALEVLV